MSLMMFSNVMVITPVSEIKKYKLVTKHIEVGGTNMSKHGHPPGGSRSMPCQQGSVLIPPKVSPHCQILNKGRNVPKHS